jgi:hypothetical protein
MTSSKQSWALLVAAYHPDDDCTLFQCQICFTSGDDVALGWCRSLVCRECMTQLGNRRLPCPNQSNLCWARNADGSWKMRDNDTHAYVECDAMCIITPANKKVVADRILEAYALKATLHDFNVLVECATPFFTIHNRHSFPNDLRQVSPTQLLALARLASATFPEVGQNPAMIADVIDEWVREHRAHVTGGPPPRDASLGFKPPVPYVAVQPPQLPQPVQQRLHAGHILKKTIPNTFGAAHGYPGKELNPAYEGYKTRVPNAPEFPTYQQPVGEEPAYPHSFEMHREDASKEMRRYWLKYGGAPVMPVHYNMKGQGKGSKQMHPFKDNGSPGYAADWVKMDAGRMYWRGLITSHDRRIRENAKTRAKALEVLENI